MNDTFQAICHILDQYYPDPPIPLHFQSPFTLLVAVMLSAQSTDARVNQITPILWSTLGNTPDDIANHTSQEILNIIRPCGLGPRKSEAILEMSRILCDKYQGQVPQARHELEALPGVGRKTANVILSHIFNQPAFPVDTHVQRLACRWNWSTAKTPTAIEKDLCQLFPPQLWHKRHLQMIWFGRNYCIAKKHDQQTCPACKLL